jgi:hypothetical protein
LILRRLRERAGLTGEDAGTALERSGSWVSRVETGRVGLRGRDLNDLLELYRIDDPETAESLAALAKEGKGRGWWSKYADIVGSSYATYIGFESEASEVLSYESLCVPGLLQTAEYARAQIGRAMPAPSEDQLVRRVEVRMARQRVLTRARPLGLTAVIDEACLHRQVGGPEVMAAQLNHLIDCSRHANVDLRVVPYRSASGHPGTLASFTLIRFALPDDPDLVYLEGTFRDAFVESEDVHWYRDVFDSLRAAALGAEETRQRIRNLLGSMP